MDIIQGGASVKIAGAKIGDTIMIHLNNGKIEKVLLSSINRNGVEGFELSLLPKPLTFYPFTAMIKVTKYNEIE